MKKKEKEAWLRAVALREFAKALVEMKAAEINELAAVLKEEYGIVPAPPKVLSKNQETVCKCGAESPKQFLKKQQSRDYFVPKKMGKVCSKPKKRF